MVPSEIFHSRILVSERGGWRLAGFVQCRRWDVQPFPYVPAASLDDYLSGRRRRAAPKKIGNLENSYWALAAGITKSFCKDKLYISLDVNNILSTKLKKETVRWDNSYYSVLRQPRGHRSLRLVFSIGYRFNRNAKKSVSTVQTLRDPEEILK